ncbi:MAG: hypothetical protein DRH15_12160 [Deltaproteobacteria bacterium]|nr:MAG: hypothetical protein DRH15_12160 [Deltaproteobacteria bacterium]
MYNFKDYWKKSTVTFKSRLQIKRRTMELTPLIDVVFLLLIFFMLTSSFISQPGIKINLPKALTGQLLQKDTLVLTITEDNRIYFNNKRILFKELKDKLKDVDRKEQTLLIKADKQASLGRIVEVWDLCRELGIHQVNIATTTKE